MGRKIECPYADGAFVELPERWLGKHAARRDEALEKAKDMPVTLANFAISMALLDNWNLPGLEGNPEAWDFTELELPVIVWVNHIVLNDYSKCFIIPKAYSAPSTTGRQKPETMTGADGS